MCGCGEPSPQVRNRLFLENKCLNGVETGEWDQDGDGGLSEQELVRVLARSYCMYQGGAELYVEWEEERGRDHTGARKRERSRRAGEGEGNGFVIDVPVEWPTYACKIQNSIKVVLEKSAPRFSVAMVKARGC